MRLLTIFSVLLAAGPAMADSLTALHGGRARTGSMLSLHCATCPPLKPKHQKGEYRVPELAPGVSSSTEVMDIDGQKKLVRTENWLGGSPSVHITRLPDWMTGSSDHHWIDAESTTSAVKTADDDAAEAASVKPAATAIAPDSLELRLGE